MRITSQPHIPGLAVLVAAQAPAPTTFSIVATATRGWAQMADDPARHPDQGEVHYRAGFESFEDPKPKAAMGIELGAAYAHGVKRRPRELRKRAARTGRPGGEHAPAEERRRAPPRAMHS